METVLIYPPREESTLINQVLKPAGVEARRVIEVPLTEAMWNGRRGYGHWISGALGSGAGGGSGQRLPFVPLRGRGFRRQWYAVTLRNQPRRRFWRSF